MQYRAQYKYNQASSLKQEYECVALLFYLYSVVLKC